MKNTIVLLEKGTGKTEEAQNIEIPDLWHLAMLLKDYQNGRGYKIGDTSFLAQYADAVLDTWHKAHAMKQHIIEH